MKRHLPIITEATFDQIDIATPCSVDWDQMAGDERVRHCSDCRLNVYNLTEMTRAEAVTLIAANETGRTCVRLYRRPDGTLLTQDCWARLRAARQRGWLAFAAALVVVGLTQLGFRFAALGWLIQRTQARPPVAAPLLPPAPPLVPSTSPHVPVVKPPEPPMLMGVMVAPIHKAPVVKTKKAKR